MELKRLRTFKQYVKFKKLYLSAFPSNERKYLWMILTKYFQHCSDIWIIEENNTFSGIAITINGDDLILLDYFAIDKNKQGKGIGSKALQKLQQIYQDKNFFLEIESIYIESNNPEQRIRRKHFYLRNNMTEMNVMVKAFGTELELLGYNCNVTFKDYYNLYLTTYGKKIARHFSEVSDAEAKK